MLINSKKIKCTTCKHFSEVLDPSNQIIRGQPSEPTRTGTCRVMPPAVCCKADQLEPIYASIGANQEPGVGSDMWWCSVYMKDSQNRRNPILLESPELIVDGDMEIDDAGQKWTSGNNTTKTKRTATPDPHSGTRYLRVAATADHTAPSVYQSRFLYVPQLDSVLRIHGWASGDGINKPSVWFHNVKIWEGVVTAAWQECDYYVLPFMWNAIVEFIPYQKTRTFLLKLMSGDATIDIAGYCDFDDFSVKQYANRDVNISCWSCRHFQAMAGLRAGECRRPIPGQQCVDFGYAPPGAEPCFPRMFDSTFQWCSAWMLHTGPGVAAPPVIWDPENPPDLYPHNIA